MDISLIDKIVVRSRFLPPFPIDMKAPSSGLAQALQPEFQIFLAGSSSPLTYAPYGKPTVNQWPLVRNSLLAAGALVGYLLYRGVTR